MVDIISFFKEKLTKNKVKSIAKTEQTAEIRQLNQEFAEHPSRGLTPARLAAIFEEAERGDLLAQCDLFEDMEEKDGHILAELGKRKRALLGLGWEVKPARNASDQEIKTAEDINKILLNIPNFEDVLLNLADAIGYGYSCLEIKWTNINGVWVPEQLIHRPPRWFTVTQERRNILRLRDNSADGVELWPLGWLVHIHKAKSGDLTRAGLHRVLAWPFLFKNYSVRDLAEFLEIYGLPIRIGQYPPGATDNEKNTLLKAVVNMGHAAAGIIPENMLIEFKEAAQGNGDPYSVMIDWCERTQSKAILGGTLTSQADGKSSTNALGNVHNEVRHDLLVADSMQISGTLSTLIKMICHVNGWGSDELRCPTFEFDTVEPEDLALYAEAIPKLVDVGVPIPINHIMEKLKIPQAKDGEEILTRVTEPQRALSALKAEPGTVFTSDQQAIEDLADNTLDNSEGPIDPEIIAMAIRNAISPEDLEERLAVIMANADISEFSEVLEKSLYAADVMGYAHA